jgi:hypothetical protein
MHLAKPHADGITLMPDTQPVLITTAVIWQAPLDDDAMSSRLDLVSNALQAAFHRVIEQIPNCTSTGVISFHYLGNAVENALRCAVCGVWASDFKKPNAIDGIGLGSMLDDRFLCTQCYNHKPATVAEDATGPEAN